MSRGHAYIVNGKLPNFLYKNKLYENMFVMPLDIAEIKQRKHVQGNDIQDAIKPFNCYTTYYLNKLAWLIIGVNGFFILFA